MDARSHRDAGHQQKPSDPSSTAVRRQTSRDLRDDGRRAQRGGDLNGDERRSYRRDGSPGSSRSPRRRWPRDHTHDISDSNRKRTRSKQRGENSMNSPPRQRRRRERSRSGERYTSRKWSRPRSRSRSRSPQRDAPRHRQQRWHSRSRSRSLPRRSHAALPSQDESFRQEVGIGPPNDSAPAKQKPNFKPTGLLAKEANTVAGTSTVLKYHEPPEARKPPARQRWRMYVFKKKELLDTVHLHQRSCWLLGRDAKVTDLHLEHPSISKQHAVIQFRSLTVTDEFGDRTSSVKPYLIDLESANGTRLNDNAIETSRFIELVDGDVVSFGESEREYVMMLPPAD